MNWEELLSSLRADYHEKQIRLTPDEVKFIANKDSRQGKLIGVFTRDYYQREKLIREGEIVYCYTYKTYIPEGKASRPYPSWCLFSPSKKFESEPLLLEKVAARLLEFADDESQRGIKNHRLQTMIKGELSEPAYVTLPLELTDNQLVYLQYVSVKEQHIYDFSLGINLLLIHPAASKEAIYLPRRYWTEEYRAFYHHEESNKQHEQEGN
ncbi:MAG TPA: hypothetical protein PKC96_01465 [Bacilli bacterium]|jgi:hypothetical protein|nr:hypothetical protein [Bacilli bacterium]